MYKIPTFILFVLFFQYSFAQSPEALLEKVKDEYTSEKVFFHFDKTNYLAGETLFFKAYLMEGILPSAVSTVLSVELINDSGRTVIKEILPVLGSTANGSIILAKTLPEGGYRIRAYTAYMMNFGSEKFYMHSFDVFNPDLPAKKETVVAKYDVQFLPEGGNLVGDLPNKVAFISNDQWGKPMPLEGSLQDPTGKPVVFFSTNYNGMGSFEFIPKAGMQYTAVYTIGTTEGSVSLAPVLSSGIVLGTKRKNGKLFFQVRKPASVLEQDLPGYLLGVDENIVVFKIPLQGMGAGIEGEIPVGSLPSGILQLTVFNLKDKPLAEKLVFINSQDHELAATLNINEKGLNKREKNEYSLVLRDTFPGTFSVSVTDADDEIASAPAKDNIVSRFLLSSDIKGKVYDAPSYFVTNTDKDKDHLDLVMLTHGWRRYSWNEILTNRFPAMSFRDPVFVSPMGEVLHPTTNKPFPGADLVAFINTKDSGFEMISVPVDKDGQFVIPGLMYQDTAKFTFRNNSSKNKETNIRLKSMPFYSTLQSAPVAQKNTILMALKDEEAMRRRFYFGASSPGSGLLLKNVIVTAKAVSKEDNVRKTYTTGSLGGYANKTLDFINEPPTKTGGNILDYLKSRISGVTITGPPYSINYRQSFSLSSGLIEMNVYIDEQPSTAAQAATYQLSEIALVEVYNSGLAGGTGGALAIYTRKGGDRINSSGYNGVSQFRIPGFTPVKEFYSPNYSEEKDKSILDDERSTLYWNPYLISNAENKTLKFSFYNNDVTKRFKVVLQGMTEEGKLLNIEKIIE